MLSKARKLQEQGKHMEAIDVLSLALKANHEDILALLSRSESYLALGFPLYAASDAKSAYEVATRNSVKEIKNVSEKEQRNVPFPMVCMMAYAEALYEMDAYQKSEQILTIIDDLHNSHKAPLPQAALNLILSTLFIFDNHPLHKKLLADVKSESYAELQKSLKEKKVSKLFSTSGKLPTISLVNREVALDWNAVLSENSLDSLVQYKNGKLVAAKDFKEGDVVFVETPLLCATNEVNACHHCIKITEDLIGACDFCKVKCCSKQCAENMAVYHSCSKWFIKSATPMFPPNLLLNKYHGLLKKVNPKSLALKKRILGLPIKENQKTVFFKVEKTRYLKFLGSLKEGEWQDFRWYREMSARFEAALSFTNSKSDATMIALLPLVGLLAKSDEANVRLELKITSEGKIFIIATKSIKKNEELILA